MMDPPVSAVWLEGGIISEQMCQYDQAIQYFNKAIQLDEWNIEAYNKLSLTLSSLSRTGEALHCLENAIERLKCSFAEGDYK